MATKLEEEYLKMSLENLRGYYAEIEKADHFDPQRKHDALMEISTDIINITEELEMIERNKQVKRFIWFFAFIILFFSVVLIFEMFYGFN